MVLALSAQGIDLAPGLVPLSGKTAAFVVVSVFRHDLLRSLHCAFRAFHMAPSARLVTIRRREISSAASGLFSSVSASKSTSLAYDPSASGARGATPPSSSARETDRIPGGQPSLIIANSSNKSCRAVSKPSSERLCSSKYPKTASCRCSNECCSRSNPLLSSPSRYAKHASTQRWSGPLSAKGGGGCGFCRGWMGRGGGTTSRSNGSPASTRSQSPNRLP